MHMSCEAKSAKKGSTKHQLSQQTWTEQ